MGASDAVELLIHDHGDVIVDPGGYRKTFAEDKPYESFLQRNGMSMEDMLEKFHWGKDDDEWCAEYDKEPNDSRRMIALRRRVYFCVGGWREINEDFGRGDVSCLRDMRTPFVTSRTPLKAMKDEFEFQK